MSVSREADLNGSTRAQYAKLFELLDFFQRMRRGRGQPQQELPTISYRPKCCRNRAGRARKSGSPSRTIGIGDREK